MSDGRELEGLGPRFEVLGELGRGAGSCVYEVRDRVLGSRRALKITTGRGQRLRLQREYTCLSELRHPNIVRAYDFGTTALGQSYYTMELVRGVHLGAFASRTDPEVLGTIAMQVLDALGTMHARGLVHRDIKPNNILVVGEGPAALVRLIDLGFVVRAQSSAKSAGTLPYMAPEVARGELVDGRADLYSLGVVLYEALLPNDTAQTVQDVVRRFVTQPVPPAELNPAIAQGLSDFVMRLLVPEREARFRTAEQAADALAHVSGMRLGRGPPRAGAERLMRGGATSHRTQDIKRVLNVANDVRQTGRSKTFFIEAGPGMGKTPFLRELAMRFNLQGATVLPIKTGSESSAPLPALLRAVLALAQVKGEPQPEVVVQNADLQEQLAAHAALLGPVFRDRLLVLLVDDLHKAEPMVLDALRRFVGALANVAALVVLTADPRTDGRRLAEAFDDVATPLTLLPLATREVAHLAAQRLVGLKLPPPALHRLVHDTAGMPSLIERTLARLLVDQTVQRDAHKFFFAGGRYRAAAHGDLDLIAARIAQVLPEHRTVLWASAVLGSDIQAESAAFVADVSVAFATQVLATFLRVELLAPGEVSHVPLYKFASRSLLNSVYQSIPSDARQRLHDRAAQVLQRIQRGGGRSEEHVEHLLKGSDDALAVLAAQEAGDRAAAVFADRRAIEYYARAFARLGATQDARASGLALQLGKLFARGGELERAIDWLRTATDVAQPYSPANIEATLELGAVYLSHGNVALAAEQATQARALLHQASDSSYVPEAERLDALVAMQRGDSAVAERSFTRALLAFEKSGQQNQVGLVLLDLARLARQRGDIVRAVRYARRALSAARETGNAAAQAEASAVLGRGFVRAARFKTARRVLLRGLRVARGAGDKLREALVQREMGNLRLRQGQFVAALSRYTRGLELARVVRSRMDESACLHNIGLVRGRLGEYRPALAALTAALEVAELVDDVQGIAATRVELGHLYAQMGDYATAAAVLSAAQKLGAQLQDPVIESESHALLAYVGLARGDSSWVAQAVQMVRQKIEKIDDPGGRALALLYAGRACLGAGDPFTARTLAERLRSEVAEAGLRDYDAAARGLLGHALLELGERDLAVQHLGDAVRGAQASRERPLEVSLRWVLGGLEAGRDSGVEHLTRAMELTREMGLALPQNLLQSYLRRPEATGLQAAFRHERQRLLGALSTQLGPV